MQLAYGLKGLVGFLGCSGILLDLFDDDLFLLEVDLFLVLSLLLELIALLLYDGHDLLEFLFVEIGHGYEVFFFAAVLDKLLMGLYFLLLNKVVESLLESVEFGFFALLGMFGELVETVDDALNGFGHLNGLVFLGGYLRCGIVILWFGCRCGSFCSRGLVPCLCRCFGRFSSLCLCFRSGGGSGSLFCLRRCGWCLFYGHGCVGGCFGSSALCLLGIGLCLGRLGLRGLFCSLVYLFSCGSGSVIGCGRRVECLLLGLVAEIVFHDV